MQFLELLVFGNDYYIVILSAVHNEAFIAQKFLNNLTTCKNFYQSNINKIFHQIKQLNLYNLTLPHKLNFFNRHYTRKCYNYNRPTPEPLSLLLPSSCYLLLVVSPIFSLSLSFSSYSSLVCLLLVVLCVVLWVSLSMIRVQTN